MKKIYCRKLRNFYAMDNSITKWVKIPSLKNDPEHFDNNVEKLKMLSYKTWCTKNTKAKSYLQNGDFHIYLVDGEPKLCVRFIDNKIEELQGERNNGIVPCKYADNTEDYFQKNNLTDKIFLDKIQQAKDAKKDFLKLQKKYKKHKHNKYFDKFLNVIGINTKKQIDSTSVFKEFGIVSHKLPDGTLSISEYRQPSEYYTFADIGIDENKLFKNVSEIRGNAVFRNTALKSLGKLHTIYGNATFANSNLEDLGNLQTIEGNAKFVRTNLTSLNHLEKIGKNLGILDSELTDLGQLKQIGGNALFKNSRIETLKNVEYIGNDAIFINDNIKSMGHLQNIDGDVLLSPEHNLAPKDFDKIIVGGNIKVHAQH